MGQGLLKTLEAIGKKAGEQYIKSSYQSAEVYFSIPLEVVKILKNPPVHPVFSKLGRELSIALNKAYHALQAKQIQNKGPLDANEIHSVTEGDVTVVLNGSMKVLEIGSSLEFEEPDAAKAFLQDVVVAANAGYLRTQIKMSELAQGMKQA